MTPSMIEIEGRVVATDILTEPFCCDLLRCGGRCCVEGDSGAPLTAEEAETLRRLYDTYRPFMTPEGIEVVERQGFAVVDSDDELTTPLVGREQCAYVFEKDGIVFCAVERAWREGLTDFPKPVSCHLYPIRVKNFAGGGEGLHYHRWSVCRPAVEQGNRIGVPLYRALREPIVRVWGEEFYDALESAAEYLGKGQESG